MRRMLDAIRSRDDDRGVALTAVLGIGVIVMILAATMVGLSTSGATKSASDRDYANAMAAAYAGLADYQSRVNADNTYATKYGDSAQPFSAGNTFPNRTGDNAAFTTWVAVPDSTGAGGSTFYRYAVDNSIYGQQGIVRVQVTGKAGNTTRTLVANVKPDGFSNYLYWTDYESGDPDITGEDCSNVYQNATFSNSPGGGKSACSRIQFQDGDTLNGPIRSNDVMLICGGTFKNTVQSAVGTTDYGCSPKRTPSYQYYSGYAPETVGSYTPPSTISAGRDRMYTDDSAIISTTPGTGCLYTGPTQITFLGNGKMTVRSPLTLKTNLQKSGPDYGSEPTKCGAIADLQGAGATLSTSLLANNLVYVQDEPASAGSGSSTNPNYYWSKYTTRNAPSACMKSPSVTDNGLGFPYTGKISGYSGTYSESVPRNAQGDPVPFSSAYGCSNGDLFVSGKVDASITLSAENYVYITGDLQYVTNRAASTVLGIVGQEAVMVWNPMYFSGASAYAFLADNRTVAGAILSNQGTFTVQNYAYGGGRGTLTVNGSIAQRYRGAVGKGSNGYLKAYGYDTSLASYTPPFFPQPVVTTYKVTSQIEVKPAYDGGGSPR